MKNKTLISKENLIKQIAKKAAISADKAKKAYECVLNESPAFRKQALKTVSVKDQVAVKVAGKQTVKKVQLKHSVPVVKKEVKIQKVEVIVEKIIEKPVEIIKTVEVIKEVPVEVVKEVIKEVKVEREVPIEVIKEVTLVREVVDKTEELRLSEINAKQATQIKNTEREIAKLKTDLDKTKKDASSLKEDLAKAKKDSQNAAKLEAQSKKKEDAWAATLDTWKKKETAWKKETAEWKSEVSNLKKELSKKPKTIEVIKEVPVEIIREVEVVKSLDMEMLKSMVSKLGKTQISKKVVGETRNVKEGKIVSRKEVKPGSTKGKIVKADDLTKIEGIGPKIAEHLNNDGIKTFRNLANAKVTKLQSILDAAGPRYKMHVPNSWPKQAKLAADGEWAALEKLQDELDGGR